MYMNGAVIGTVQTTTKAVLSKIRQGQVAAPIAFSAAGRGSGTRRIAVQRFAAAPRPVIAATSLVSVWPGPINPLLLLPFYP